MLQDGTRSDGLSGAVVSQEPWSLRAGGLSGAVVSREPWSVRSSGLSGAVVSQGRWSLRGGGLSVAVVCQEQWSLRSCGLSGAVVSGSRSSDGLLDEASSLSGGVFCSPGPGLRSLSCPSCSSSVTTEDALSPPGRKFSALMFCTSLGKVSL